MEGKMQTNESTTKPLVLLDVDGVINDLGALYGRERPWYVHQVPSNGYVLHIPEYMPALIADLVATAEVWWCTTWRDRANNELAEFLGIDRLPVVDDGSRDRNVEWKPAAAHAVAKAALDAGREVFWIEDFYGILPTSCHAGRRCLHRYRHRSGWSGPDRGHDSQPDCGRPSGSTSSV